MNQTTPTRLEEALSKYYEEAEAGRLVDHDGLLHEFADVADELREFFESEAILLDYAGPTAVEAGMETAMLDTSRIGAVGNTSIAPTIAHVDAADRIEGIPETFGRYTIETCLGSGAMGAVFRAYDQKLDRRVALKVPKMRLEAGSDAWDRFEREAQAAARLRHPNICAVHDVGEHDGLHYIAMAYVEGETLEDRLKANGPLPIDEAVAIIRKLAAALASAHVEGVVHRDLKPANVMLDGDGEPVITDFGLAVQFERPETRITQHGTIVGTPAYMAPEQIEGDPEQHGPAVDVYALGIMLYECLTGHVPFRGTITSVVSQALGRLPDPPSTIRLEVPPHLDEVCLRMLAKSAGDRFPTMGDVTAALDAEPRATAARPRWTWTVIAAVTSLAAVAVVVAFLFGDPPAEEKSNETAAKAPQSEGEPSETSKPSRVERPTLIRRFEGDHQRVWSVAISPDGKFAASGGGHETPWQEGMTDGIVIWNFEHGDIVRRLPLKKANVRGLQFSPSGRRLLAARREVGQLQLWDLESGRSVQIVGKGGCWEAEFFNERFVVENEGGSIRVWDLELEQVVASYPQSHGIVSMSLHRPTSRLAVGLKSGVVRVLNLDDGSEVQRVSAPPPNREIRPHWVLWPRDLAFSPDGSRLAAGISFKGVCCWDVASGELVYEMEAPAETVAWTRDGQSLVGGTNGRLSLFDVSGKKEPIVFQFDLRIRDIDVAPDGGSFLLGGGPRWKQDDRDFALQHWRLPDELVPDSVPKPAEADVPVAWLRGSKQVDSPTAPKVVASTVTGIVLDDDEAELVGDWTTSTFHAGFTGKGYRHDDTAGKGEKSATYRMPVEKAGTYQLLVSYTAAKGRDQQVPVTIHAAEGPATVKVNQEAHPQLGTGFQPLGEFTLEAGVVDVVIENKGTTGSVIIDAVRLLTPEQFEVSLEKEKGKSQEQRAWEQLVKTDKLLGHFTKQIEKSPDLPEHYRTRGDYLRVLAGRRGNDAMLLRRARADFKKAVALRPNDWYSTFQMAFLHEVFAERDECDRAYRRAAKLLRDKKNRNETEERHLAWSYLNNCMNLVRKGDFEGAMEMGDAAVAVAPAMPKAQMNRAIAYKAHRDYATALESLDSALQAAGGLYPDAFLAKADILDILGDLPRAQENAGYALQTGGGPQAARALAAYSSALGQYESALFVVDQLQEALPDDAWTASLQGRTLARAGDFDGAIEACDEALKLSDEPLFRVKRAKLLRYRGRHADAEKDELKALADFTEEIEEDGTNTVALERRARLHWDRGQLDESLADWEKVVEHDPRDEFGLSHLALLLSSHPDAEHRDGKRAVELAKRLEEIVVLEGRQKRAYFVSVLAAAHAENENWDEALRLQREALAACPLTEYAAYSERLSLYEKQEPFRLEAEPEDVMETFADVVVPKSVDAGSFDALKPFAAKPLPPPQIAKERPATVLVQSDHGFGTGMIVDRRGYVLTCAHVLPYAGPFTIHYESGGLDREAPGVPIAIDYRNDLALVRFDVPQGVALRTVHLGLQDGKPTKFNAGSTAVVIGNPGNGNWVLKKVVLTGTIASERQAIGDFLERPFVQVSANVAPGCSGGPLFDDRGRVVGVVAQQASDLDETGFAVPMDRVARFLGLGKDANVPAQARK